MSAIRLFSPHGGRVCSCCGRRAAAEAALDVAMDEMTDEEWEEFRIACERAIESNMPNYIGYRILHFFLYDAANNKEVRAMVLTRDPPAGETRSVDAVLACVDGLLEEVVDEQNARERRTGNQQWLPALALGGGATCDSAGGQLIERSTKELWFFGRPMVGCGSFWPRIFLCQVWHLAGGGYVYPASRSGICTRLTYLCHPRGSEVVIYEYPWSDRDLRAVAAECWRHICHIGAWVAILTFGVVAAMEGLHLLEQVSDPRLSPTAAQAARKREAATARELKQDMLEREVSAGVVHMRRLSFAEDPIRAFLCLWLFLAVLFGIWISPLLYQEFFKKGPAAPDAAAEAAAEAAAAELLANEPAPRDSARPGLRRRAHRGRRRGRARGTAADEPSATESKLEAPAAPELKAEEPSPEAKGEEEETPAATGPPPGKKVLVDDDILDDAAAHARTLETSLTAHQAEVQRLKKILRQQQRDIPDAYVCPISLEPMEDPVLAADGHSFERREIVRHFDLGRRTSPMTGAQLPHTHLMPNHALKSAIQDFLEEVRRFDAATAGAQD